MPDLGAFPALDVGIGLVALYFLLSTALSTINEAIANLLGWRAKTLEDAIRNMLGDPEVKRGWKEWIGRIQKKEVERPATTPEGEPAAEVPPDLTSTVFGHWRIEALVRDPSSSVRRRSRPSYLPPGALSLAVAETLAAGAPERPEGPSLWQQTDEQIFDRARDALRALPDGQARRVLQKAVANADDTLEGFRVQFERAFDDAMERASGWYKRKVQIVVVVLAALVAIGLNVDTVKVATRLWNDEATRAAAVAQASERQPEDAADALEEVDQLQLPVGWGSGNAPDDVGGVVSSVPGWLLTIAALTLGAPFWFDLLSRLARLRGSGVPEKPRSLSDTAGTEPPRERRAAAASSPTGQDG